MRKSILIFCVFFVATFMINVSAYANYAVLQVDNPKMSVNGELQTIDRSSAYNILNQALSTYNQTISIANQLGLSNDPAAIHARNRINEIRRIMR